MTWGEIIQNQDNKFYLIQDKHDKDKYYQIYKHKKHSTVEVRKKNKILLTFEDRDIKFHPWLYAGGNAAGIESDRRLLRYYIKREEYYIFI